MTEIREREHDRQGRICPVLRKEVLHEDIVLDHKHKRKADPVGVNGDGICRGAIERFANALEGKITNNFTRMGLGKFIDLPTFLRNLADYLEDPPMWRASTWFIHLDEKPTSRRLMKSEFNRVIKYWDKMYPGKKPPEMPKKRGKKMPIVTEKWAKYISDADDLHTGKVPDRPKRKLVRRR